MVKNHFYDFSNISLIGRQRIINYPNFHHILFLKERKAPIPTPVHAYTPTSVHLAYIFFLSKIDISLYRTCRTLHHTNPVILHHLHTQSKTLKLFSMYLTPSNNTKFFQKKQCPYTDHYEITRHTPDFSCQCIWINLQLNDSNLTYVQPSTFKYTPTDSNIHTSTWTHIHTYICTN